MLFAAQSIVFDKMLFGNMIESQPNGNVIIHDIDVSTFKWIKKYVYGLNSMLTPDNIVQVL